MKWFKINSEKTLEEFIESVTIEYHTNKHTYAKFENSRTLDQNSGFHLWMKQCEKEFGQSEKFYKNYCKYHFGLPILKKGHEEYYKKIICLMRPFKNESQRINIMDLFPVSSEFKVAEMTKYLESVRNHFAEYGLILELDKDMKKRR